MALRRLMRIALAGLTAVGLSSLPAGTGPASSAVPGMVLTLEQWQLMSGSTQQALLASGVHVVLAATPGQEDPAFPLPTRLEDLSAGGAGPSAVQIGAPLNGPAGPSGGFPNVFPGPDNTCRVELGQTIRVNNDCENVSDVDLHGRAQAQNETAIAVNPLNPSQVIASSNDYRRGDGACGAYFSQDGGNHWGGGLAPHGFVRGFPTLQRQYWEAGGDTSVAWDSSGTAYLMCQVFNRGRPVTQDPDQSNALLVFRSANGGASWNFPGAVAAAHGPQTTQSPLHDKPYMTVDNHPGSPFQDRIYITWTEFAASVRIMETHSSDHGKTFSSPVQVSTTSPFCISFGNQCSSNQFSAPVVAPDGSLNIAWINTNTQRVANGENHLQVLYAKSTDGGATFSTPNQVGFYYELPDCQTYTGQDPGRACVPVKGPTQTSYFRVTNYPSIVVDPNDSSHIYVHYGSYINQHSNEANGCAPAGFVGVNGKYTGVTLPGSCNNDILVSESVDGGASFTGTSADPRGMPSANPDNTYSDQFWQWSAITPDGTPVVSYYDRQYGQDESTGFSDITVATAAGGVRVTDTSMPPPSQFDGLFLGDYSGLAVGVRSENGVSSLVALPIWSDTRNVGVTSCPADPRQLCQFGNDEDVFVGIVSIPGLGSRPDKPPRSLPPNR